MTTQLRMPKELEDQTPFIKADVALQAQPGDIVIMANQVALDALVPGGVEVQPVSKRWSRSFMCSLNMHGGKWEFIAKGACTQSKTCDHCATVSVQTRHRHEWKYLQAGSDLQTKICTRCQDTTDRRTRHNWGSSYSIGSDRNGHRCKPCGEVETWNNADDD